MTEKKPRQPAAALPTPAAIPALPAATTTRSRYTPVGRTTGPLYPQYERVTLTEEVPAEVRTQLATAVLGLLNSRYADYTKEGKYTTIEGYDIHPFLLLALAPMYNVNSPYEVAQHVQISKSSHGDATAWGRFIEERVLRHFGWRTPAEKKDTTIIPDTTMRRSVAWENIDQEHELDIKDCLSGAIHRNRRILLSLKSGPATIKQGDKTGMAHQFPVAYRDAGANPLVVLGVTYGRYERSNKKPDGIIADLNAPTWFDYMAGKDFWEFATGIRDFHIKVFSVIREAQRAFAAAHKDETFFEELVKARLKIASTFREQFLAGAELREGEDFWDALFKSAF